MKLREQIAAEIEAFLEESGMPPATFGRKAMSDPTFVWKVRNGHDVRSSTIDRVREYIANYKPPARRKAGNGERVAA